MKTFTSRAALLLIALATAVHGAPSAAEISKVVFQGATNPAGQFTTASLPPGAYNVEFRAPKSINLQGQTLSISVSAGKAAPREANAEGGHMQSGVGVSVELAKASPLAGKVTLKGGTQVSVQTPKAQESVNANIKVVNGKRYIWVPGSVGSNIGGKWVEEGTEGAVLKTSNKKGGDSDVLRHIQDQSGNIGNRPGG